MDYEPCPSDNSDTDEGLAAHQNRHQRASHISGNGNPMLGSGPYRRVHRDMEHQIHHLEKEAYCAVLKAFKAQSDAITWDKEGLMTELRKELRVSDDEHRELLFNVDNDDTIRRIREWRQAGGHLNASHPINDVPSPTPSASRRRPRTLQPLHPNAAPMQPAPTVPTVPSRGRRPRQFPYGSQVANETPIPGSGEQLIGRKVLTRWPDDNHFYEAVVTRYNQSDGRHALVYGMNTPEESFEWVNIMEIPPEDIRWVNEDRGLSRRGVPEDPGLSHRGVPEDLGLSRRGGPEDPGLPRRVVPEDPGLSRRGGPGERSIAPVPSAARKKLRNDQQNGVGNMADDIEILHTDTLIKEVEKVVCARNPDRLDIEKAKKMLKDHEDALLEAISRLNYVSDGDSDGDQFYRPQT
ncbi:hypothetical protein vseg_008154 [Gypsophila vaccaria]